MRFVLLLGKKEALRKLLQISGIGIALAGFMVPSVWAETADRRDEETPVYVAFSAGMFPETNKNDAKAAIKVWADTLAQTKGLHFTAATEVYETLPALRKALDAGRADIVSVRIDEYLDTLHRWLEPAFIGLRGKNATEEYLLITRKVVDTNNLGRLKGATLTMLDSGRTGLAGIWLDTVLLEHGLPASTGFFSEIKRVGKVSKAVLPVFFGQMMACLVTRSGFQTMVELNPQVGTQLAVVRSSPPVLPSLMCLSRSFSHGNRDEIEEALAELHLDNRGRQVLMLFGVDRLIACRAEDLDAARNIFRRYQQLNSAVSTGRFSISPAIRAGGSERRR